MKPYLPAVGLTLAAAAAGIVIVLLAGFLLPTALPTAPVIGLLTLIGVAAACALTLIALRGLTFTRKQIEALQLLTAVLPLRSVIPSIGGWAASADCLHLIAGLALRQKPQLIVEASSGVSTLILGYCVQKNGAGKVISLEHDAEHVRRSRELVEAHGLSDVVQVVHAPLKAHTINGREWMWYTLDGVEFGGEIDFLFVDGPPKSTQALARYPALPLLAERLSAKAVVVLDDGQRRGERQTVARWKQEQHLYSRYYPLEKGAFVLSRQAERL